jgi:hypothetical protein
MTTKDGIWEPEVEDLRKLETVRALLLGIEHTAMKAFWCSKGTTYDATYTALQTCATALDNCIKKLQTGGRCDRGYIEIGGICVRISG